MSNVNPASDSGIGTLSERSLHKVLKLYFEPDSSFHEIETHGAVADIKNGEGIIEIQRQSFSYLIPKLNRFLQDTPVTVVYPIAAVKTLVTVDKSGEVISRRKSPGRKTIHDASFELFKIRDFISSPRLNVKLLFLECDEYRKEGRGKRRGELLEMIPRRIIHEIDLKSAADYSVFLPSTLTDVFLAKDFMRHIKSRSRYSYYSLRLLLHTGHLEIAGKSGRAFIYKRI